jgi:DNA-binding GntR family transcriptional regulator
LKSTIKKEEVYLAIKSQIVKMALKPGDVLSDRKLAQEFKVSRTPVREALTLLQQEGYVLQGRGGGFSVKGINLKEIEDMYNVREALEVKALKTAYHNNFENNLKKLRRLIEVHSANLKQFNPGNRFLQGADFHRELVLMSSNDYLIKIIESIYERLERLHYIENLSREQAEQAHFGHTEIVSLLEKQKFAEAEELLSKHVLASKDEFINRIKNRFEIIYY